jgi:hypothetical protein
LKENPHTGKCLVTAPEAFGYHCKEAGTKKSQESREEANGRKKVRKRAIGID